ncbi:NAD-dependent succinate-semialdehyde dehydrogenase [Pelagibacterium halotolerans]|uniref:Putative aldehyde dehydrogenase n=1 Tax=Pelagibacterium halotolerans (strain DSM 22347 / JCM 15775 / CGMCC 1.7692 / B2) TaxID=1082931 RepID=G4RBG8_PELHB|nr:NAD-dependent succinate-semialdehyde dehydrogenase [Pelagibacterium halotolerans]AEQ52644.1 putative aldehyde dehydrogenase [Pelagibacterium halotolerans B2]QJR17651.1 NAD-dependent succinate-semialdehyde dehydrogenase [Pelagibacterium halotolerans]SEA83722.1 succinate semialdehyde dehydrogenase [Pelagibacterium halotolerans]
MRNEAVQVYPALSMYIGGQFIGADSRDGQTVINPANGMPLGTLPHATIGDLDCALAAAAAAFESWRWSSPTGRAAILRKVAGMVRERAETLALNITRDQGKPLAEACIEVSGAADHLEWHAEECRRIYGRVIPARSASVRQTVIRQPIGVCAAFSPWNFPLNQGLRKICAALGAGCTLILKPAEEAPSCMVAVAEMFEEAGLPPGVLNIVWGVPSEISDYLIRSPIVRKVSFTGSVAVGKHLAALAGAHMKRVTMELGGHSPVIVCDDADIERAATLLAGYKGLNAGQVCMSPSRFFVQEGVIDAFSELFVAAYASRTLGDGLDEGTIMGPLAHERRVEAMIAIVEDALDRGARVMTGGHRPEGPGSFFPPTVLTGVADEATVMREEPFGPVVPVTSFSTIDEVLGRANSVPYGLASYAFTRSLERAHTISTRLEAGMVTINHFGLALPETPLGGVKDSGLGSEGGVETFDAYLHTKFISEQTVT